jgi:hypothetical protein
VWIEEFEQLIKTLRTPPHPSSASLPTDTSPLPLPFQSGDIDAICTMCYNWGVTLVELGQHDLAEKFASKALALIAHCSTHVHNLKDAIQV